MGSITFFLVMILSYFLLVKPLNYRIVTETEVANTRIIQQTDYLLSYVRDYLNMISIDEKFKKSYINYVNNPTAGNRSQIDLALSELVSQWNKINAIVIEIEDGETFGSIGSVTDLDEAVLSGGWYHTIRSTDYASGFSQMYETRSYSGIYSAAYAKNYYLYGKRFTATLFFNASEIVYAVQNLSREKIDGCMWMGEDGTPFYLVCDEAWSRFVVDELAHATQWDPHSFPGFGGVNTVGYSQSSGWRFVSHISNATLFQTGATYILSIVVILVLFYVLVVAFITPVVNKTIHPINVLSRTIREVSAGNLDVRVDIHTNDEIEDVGNVFNTMIDEIHRYIAQLIAKEKIEQKMRYSLLASQIDLHFIFNTMNRINYLARKQDYHDIVLINTALMKIMKDALRFNNADIMDSVATELAVVKEYLTIIGSHYNDIIDVAWDIDERLLSWRIPKNIIQPLVENAVFHGLTNEQGEVRGRVTVSIQRDAAGKIVIRVSDNGNGMSDESIAAFRSRYATRATDRGTHIGLSNIKRRLIYLFGNEDCISIESEIDRGTSVTLTFSPER